MTDEDITKLASRLTQSLATKDDIKDVKNDIKNLEKKLEKRLDKLDSKADIIMEFADEVDRTTNNHEKRLKKIEAVPVIAHQIR